MGRGGGQVVSVLAFYSDDPSSNPAEAYNFSCKNVFEKNENKQKRGRGFHIKISISTDQDLSSSAESYKALYDRSLRL